MLPDSMRIHVRKCNIRTPQKPTKKRLRERRLNPLPQAKTAKRNPYQSTRHADLNGSKKQNDHMPKYRSQRNTGGYGEKYSQKMASSQMEDQRPQKSNRKTKPTKKRAKNSRGKRPQYNDFEERNLQQASSSSRQNRIPSGRGLARDNQRGFPGKNNADMFAKMEMEGPPPPSSMSKCRVCGRTFASDRIAKHQKACVKASKKPKKIKRFHKAISKREKQKMKKNKPVPKWKQQHKEFIKQMKYMKKLKEVEEAGGDIRLMAPPPTTDNSHLIPCKYCDRKFRDAAHERHENICQKVFGGKKGITKKGSTRKVKKAKPSKGRRRY